MRGLLLKDYENALHLKVGSLWNKLNKSSFTYNDLIVLAKLTDTELCLIDKETREIVAKL